MSESDVSHRVATESPPRSSSRGGAGRQVHRRLAVPRGLPMRPVTGVMPRPLTQCPSRPHFEQLTEKSSSSRSRSAFTS